MATLKRQHYHTVIIGAGMAGLAAGIRLALADKPCLILERHEAPGGLNSFYSLRKRRYDVGLHAMTNYVSAGVKGTPLAKIFRQLRIPRDAFDLSEQCGSRIAFPGVDLHFSNDIAVLESEVEAAFPDQIDGFRRLVEFVKTFDATDLDAGERSADPVVAEFISDTLLRHMLYCPICYYGSSRENDIDLGQFVIMFSALFLEGFARPFAGVRQIIRALTQKYANLGGERRMRLGVKQIHTDGPRAQALDLVDGSTITADNIVSTAGMVETARLCSDQPKDSGAEAIGKLSFCETITVLDQQPKDLGWDETIIFFNDAERFDYQSPETGLIDPRSGVICFPNNYQYADGQQLEEGLLRVTALAHYDRWKALDPDAYAAAKEVGYTQLQTAIQPYLAQPAPENFADHILDTDMFTPLTVERFTGHLGGAIYGSTEKRKDGLTHLDNVFIAGTDQGFLGIVGAMLSGISIVNRYLVR
ncbi:MAG: FAD-dependent oxidoreductase [Opitutales bacterium]|nr:FAD-dependent oxidoreductase [Opitutales bacterium]